MPAVTTTRTTTRSDRSRSTAMAARRRAEEARARSPRPRRSQQAAEPEPLGISERCSARVEEFGAFADAEGAEWSVFRLYVDHNDGAVFGDEGEANVYELYGAPGRPLILPPAYQVPKPFGANIGGVDPALFAVEPTAQHDSWLTIGLEEGLSLIHI